MHGTGNDFAVFDARNTALNIEGHQIKRLADRYTGIGFDQMIVIRSSTAASAFMSIYNADGGEVSACGNATRCVGWLLLQEKPANEVTIETKADTLMVKAAGQQKTLVDMGIPKTEWQLIPLAEKRDTLRVDIGIRGLDAGVCINMGNPHIVFFVPDVAVVELEKLGKQIEAHSLFPKRINVSFAEISSPNLMQLRVWERGTGITRACGTAACAAVVAANRKGLADPKMEVALPGGMLEIEWRVHDNQHVWMAGEVATAYTGMVEL